MCRSLYLCNLVIFLLGIRQPTVITSKDSATLELAGIPTHLNTISSINQELSKYGTIVNIQVQI